MTAPPPTPANTASSSRRSRLFRKYVLLLVGLVAGALLISGGFSLYFLYQHEKNALANIQHEKAIAAASTIRQFIEEIESQIGWTTQLSLLPGTIGTEQRRLDYFRLLRQAPAITEIAFLDGDGKEQLRVSRLAMDAVGSQTDYSHTESFRVAQETGVYYGSVYFRKESEPYMTLAVRGSTRQGDVTVTEINLKFIRDSIVEIRVGSAGYAYVIDAHNRLVAHPDLALVLRQTDLSDIPQVQAARVQPDATQPTVAQPDKAMMTTSLEGREVLSAHATVSPMNWQVFVETPLSAAFAPLYTTLLWNVGLLLLGLLFAVCASLFLARNLVIPIQALQNGAARLGAGDLSSRIDIRSGDELQALAEYFNHMATQLQELYSELEQKVEERTRQLARSVKELETLGEVSQAVNSNLELDAVLSTIAAHAVTLAEADAGLFCAYDQHAEVFRIQAFHGMEDAIVEKLTQRPVRLGEGVLGAAGQRQSAVQIANLDQEADYTFYDIVRKPGYRALLAVPLLHENKLIGGLAIWRKTAGIFAPDTVNLVQTLANQSVLAIQNAKLFQEIEEKSRELELVSQHKSQFLANMSHELRTPLNAILGYTELITDEIYGPVPEKIREVLQRVEHNGRHLLGLINAVLDLSKIEAGQLTLTLDDYFPRELIYEAMTTVESLAAEKGLQLTAKLPEQLPTGRGDAARLRQVLLNLLGNAIKFTDQGEIKVSMTLDGEKFTITVIDTGPGIAPEQQAHIFEEFQQVDNSNTREKGGTGLGLAIAKKIIALHGGEIGVDSEPNQGSTFWFNVPVCVEQQQVAA